MKHFTLYSLVFGAAMLASTAAQANDYVITLKDKQFSPKELMIPADTKVKIIVKNQNATPAEFESHSLKREKIIGGKGQAIVLLGPLKAGKYEYFDEFQAGTTGHIVVK